MKSDKKRLLSGMKKRALRENFIYCLLSHLHTPGQSFREVSQKITEIVWKVEVEVEVEGISRCCSMIQQALCLKHTDSFMQWLARCAEEETLSESCCTINGFKTTKARKRHRGLEETPGREFDAARRRLLRSLWSRLKYQDNFWVYCHEMLYRCSWNLNDFGDPLTFPLANISLTQWNISTFTWWIGTQFSTLRHSWSSGDVCY